MKKIVCLTALLVAGAALFAQSVPAFENPKATVCSIAAIAGTAKKDVCVINATHESEMDVALSVYDGKKKEWVSYGNASFHAVTDVVTVASALKGTLKKYDYIAVVPSAEKDFKILLSKENNNLQVAILSQEEPSEYAQVMDVFAVNGTFKDAVTLVNQTEAVNAGFDIYTQKDESDTWFKVGTAFTAKKGDTCAVAVVTPDPVESYRYFSVIAFDGNYYNYEAKKEGGRLVITAR